ncbi:MAG: metalloprotease RseP, partial [Parcubacteria group bacterium Gr01-1014_66]
DIQSFVEAYRGEEITIIIRRGKEIMRLTATPRITASADEGLLGIQMGRIAIRRVPWYFAPIAGAKILAEKTNMMVYGFGELVAAVWRGRTNEVAVTGPVGIYIFADQIATLGLGYLLPFLGVLSLNLAFLNILPIPALDGGRVFFLCIEKIRGTRINPRIESMIHVTGFVLLIALMIFVTYKDVVRFF